jgi:hypothetical protein
LDFDVIEGSNDPVRLVMGGDQNCNAPAPPGADGWQRTIGQKYKCKDLDGKYSARNR